MEDDVRHFSLSSVEVARSTPELVPCFLWLVSAGHKSELVRAFRLVHPTPEELAGLVAVMGAPAREILSYRKRMKKRVDRIDTNRFGILTARLEAMKRLGLGVEQFAFLDLRSNARGR